MAYEIRAIGMRPKVDMGDKFVTDSYGLLFKNGDMLAFKSSYEADDWATGMTIYGSFIPTKVTIL
jgi:hypothetical protein